MRRLNPSDLRLDIEIQLKCMRGPARRQGGWDSEIAVKEAAELIMTRVLGGTVVLAPDLVPQRGEQACWGEAPGEFGKTEPWPFTPGHKPPKPA